MKLTISTFLGAACLAIGLLGSQPTASADMITGGVSFSGLFTPENSSGTAVTDLTQATQIAFPKGNMRPTATGGTGSFSIVSYGDKVTMAPLLKFVTPTNLPLDPFYTVDGFSFALTSITIDEQTSTVLDLSGFGTFSGNGYTATAGNYIATFNTAAGTYSFSASGATIPDGGPAVALLGLGLVAVEASRRLLNSRSVKA